MSEIKGIKMNGEVLNEFSAGGGTKLYRHVFMSSSPSTYGYIVVYTERAEPYLFGQSDYEDHYKGGAFLISPKMHIYACILKSIYVSNSGGRLYDLSATYYDEDSGTVKTGYHWEKEDKVTEVPFPWM